MDNWLNTQTYMTARHQELLTEAELARQARPFQKKSGWLAKFIAFTVILLGLIAWLAH